ncbi:uncharacterized protein LODBEIA_P36580 [Lodderomyces beijingensis]|uniref:MINDY deubiquitinase domain-containing protein n=1 Tax=Lodderomyces beijingensis TaxID=1775926 RepID=A0ABP0ZMR6_9ASCO
MSQEEVSFPIKLITWSPHINSSTSITTPVLLQDKNGPCPLIALVNTLLLHQDITAVEEIVPLPASKQTKAVANLKSELVEYCHTNASQKIKLDEILLLVGDLLLTFAEKSPKLNSRVVDRLLSQLPKLHTGLDVNPDLLEGDFAPSLATQLFSIFELQFRHGWIVDQKHKETRVVDDEEESVSRFDEVGGAGDDEDDHAQLVKTLRNLKTFDDTQDYLFVQSEDKSPDPETIRSHNLISSWLDENCTQLTREGLTKLNSDLHKNQFIIFFRNNHFNTLLKRGNDEFYLLVTDSAFRNKSLSNQIVWQSLTSVSGQGDLFFTGDFSPVLDIDQDLSYSNSNSLAAGSHHGYGETFDSDLMLSRQLQEEEDAAIAKQMQERYNKRQERSQQGQMGQTTSQQLDDKTSLKSKLKSTSKQKSAQPTQFAQPTSAMTSDEKTVQSAELTPKEGKKRKKLFGIFSKGG